MSLLAVQKQEIKQESRFYSKENLEIIMQVVKELGGSATKRQIYEFLWMPQNRERYKRPRGRAWGLDRVQHDCYGNCLLGRLWLDKVHGFTYYLSEEELWVD